MNSGLRHGQNARGATVVETIVALPILVIALMAVVEFGLLSMHQSCLQQASRAGADIASKLVLPPVGPVPAEVLTAVNAVLNCKDITPECVRLEHNIGGGPFVLISGAGASPPIAPTPAAHPYVRVSVCVQNTELAPNLLRTFCIDLAGRRSQKSTTRCYEL